MAYLKTDSTIHNSNWLPSLSSSSTQHCFSSKGRKAATLGSASLAFILLFWRVPIIILIATTGAPPTCAVSIAAASVSANSSDTYDMEEKPPNNLSFNSNEAGNGSSAGLHSLSYEPLVFNNSYQPKESEPSPAKKAEMRGGGETRVTGNQDVTTLAVAVDNSSSVAIANINSSYNNVHITIGTPNKFQYPPKPNRYF